LLDRRIGKVSGKRVPVDPCEEVEALTASRRGISTSIWCAIAWSYSWTKSVPAKPQSAGEGAAARCAPAHTAASSVAGYETHRETHGCRKHDRSTSW
jgi:hypothetical protein